MLSLSALSLAYLALASHASGAVVPAPNAPVIVTTNGQTYIWKSMVAYGFLPAETVDKFGDTMGGIGSAISVKDFKQGKNGTFSGRIVAQLDRGHTTVKLVNYAARQQLIDFVLKPCTASICNTAGAPSLTLKLAGSLKYRDTSPRNTNKGDFTTGLDPVNIRPVCKEFSSSGKPLPEAINGALSTDMEGLALMKDGSWWSSDEYGPTIYPVGKNGKILSAIQPPAAILPHLANGTLYFSTTGSETPTYGRVPNQVCPNLSPKRISLTPSQRDSKASPFRPTDNKRLYALMQSALSQDQVLCKSTRQYARMVVYDIKKPSAPVLVERYVVRLPSSDATATTVFAQSEILYVSEGVFLVLARDGKGNGNGDSPPTKKQLISAYKNIGLVILKGATNINGQYDTFSASVAPGGVLYPNITAAESVEFVNIIDPVQLARFGLNNDGLLATLSTAVPGKVESLALQPCFDPQFPNDYFLFAVGDNDFIAKSDFTNGVDAGPDPYGISVPNQVFVYRVTLPGAKVPEYLYAKASSKSPRSSPARQD